MVKVLEISGKIAEDKMKAMLNIYRVKFNNQHEIIKFIENLENLLKDNDLHMIIKLQHKEFIFFYTNICIKKI